MSRAAAVFVWRRRDGAAMMAGLEDFAPRVN